MPCPIGDHGQPLCNVVNHPDRTNQSFCATCQRRFNKRDSGFELAAVLAAIAGVLILLSGTRGGQEPVDVGANDLPPSNTASMTSTPVTLPPPSQPVEPPPIVESRDGEEESLPERVVDWPMEKQLELLNGGGDRIAFN